MSNTWSTSSHTKQVLARGGFSLKYLVESGVPPNGVASAEGAVTKFQGYDYQTVPSLISLAFPEAACLKPNSLFRRQILTSTISSFFNLFCIYEPIKLQLKLHISELFPFEGGGVFDNTLQLHWQAVLMILVGGSDLTVIGWSDSHRRALLEMEYFCQATLLPSHTLLFDLSSLLDLIVVKSQRIDSWVTSSMKKEHLFEKSVNWNSATVTWCWICPSDMSMTFESALLGKWFLWFCLLFLF